jgi:hypothetical protein
MMDVMDEVLVKCLMGREIFKAEVYQPSMKRSVILAQPPEEPPYFESGWGKNWGKFKSPNRGDTEIPIVVEAAMGLLRLRMIEYAFPREGEDYCEWFREEPSYLIRWRGGVWGKVPIGEIAEKALVRASDYLREVVLERGLWER